MPDPAFYFTAWYVIFSYSIYRMFISNLHIAPPHTHWSPAPPPYHQGESLVRHGRCERTVEDFTRCGVREVFFP